MNNVPLEAEVESKLDDVYKEYHPLIWEVKPKDTGGRSTTGKPDRIFTLNGFTIGIEAKRIMRLTNKATLPTVIQTKELMDLIRAGGAGCVVDLNSVDDFIADIKDMIKLKKDKNWFLNLDSYKNVYCIDNWAQMPESIKL